MLINLINIYIINYTLIFIYLLIILLRFIPLNLINKLSLNNFYSYISIYFKYKKLIYILFLILSGLPPFIVFLFKLNIMILIFNKQNLFNLFIFFIFFYLNMLFYIQIFFFKNKQAIKTIIFSKKQNIKNDFYLILQIILFLNISTLSVVYYNDVLVILKLITY